MGRKQYLCGIACFKTAPYENRMRGECLSDYILKLFDRELIRFSARPMGRTPQIAIQDIDAGALSLMPLGMEVSSRGLASWLKHRIVPRNRLCVSPFLSRFGLSENSTMGIIGLSRGLSLNDSYWVVPDKFTRTFAECNLYDHKLSEAAAWIALTGNGSSVRTPFVPIPEFTTHGMLPKCWRRQNGGICLYKRGTEGSFKMGNEPYSEYYAWQAAEILGVRAVPYTLTKWKSVLCSKCELFTSKELSYMSPPAMLSRMAA